MDVQQFVVRNDLNKVRDASSLQKWNSDEFSGTDNNPSNEFECNICLDFVQDPVITLCGHLYCWPCIYKWIHLQNNISVSPEYPDHQAQCPVCKAEVSSDTLVPLYGRGQITKPPNGKALQLGIVVPRRPSGPCWDMLSPTASPSPRTNIFRPSGSQPASPMVSPVNGMFGEMVYSRMFGNNSIMNLYSYPNSSHLSGTVSPRVRLHEMQADRSLSRICFFLFCCIFLCLVLF